MKGRKMSRKIIAGIFCIASFFLVCLIPGPAGLWAASAERPEDIRLEYLYINKKMIPETEKKVTFFSELLPGGRVSVAGKVAGSVEVRSVEVNIDGRRPWRKVRLAQDNTFSFRFRAQKGETYGLLIRITDAKGNTNNVEGTLRLVAILDRSLYGAVQDVLNRMIEAYQRRASGSFMAYVDDSFAREKEEYDRSVRKDMSAIHDVEIRYTLNSVTPDYKDKVSASLNFNRSYTLIRTGRRMSDQGSTAMVFRIGNGKLSLYAVNGPPLFGFIR